MPTARRRAPTRADGSGSTGAAADGPSAVNRRRSGAEVTAPAIPRAVTPGEAAESSALIDVALPDACEPAVNPAPDIDEPAEVVAVTEPECPPAPGETNVGDAETADTEGEDTDAGDAETADTEGEDTDAGDAETDDADSEDTDDAVDGVASRRATAAVKLATRPAWRRTARADEADDNEADDNEADDNEADDNEADDNDAGADEAAADEAAADVPTRLLAADAVATGVVRRRAGLADGLPVGEPVASRRGADGCSGCARRIARVRRSAVTGPGADSADAGAALPVTAAGRDIADGVGGAVALDAAEREPL